MGSVADARDGMGGESPRMKVIIVGAGIAGFTAATALKLAGHDVDIYESSTLSQETGAAITLSLNGTRVLSRFNFNFAAAGGVKMADVSSYDAETLERWSHTTLEENLQPLAFHRVDLHRVLRELALSDGKEGEKMGKVVLHLGCKVKRVDVEKGEVEFAVRGGEKGSVRAKADLVVGADGIHSILRNEVLSNLDGGKKQRAENVEERGSDSGWDINRFLIPTEVLMADADWRGLVKRNCRATYILDKGKLRLTWYECRNGEIQNLAALCPGKVELDAGLEMENYNRPANREALLKLFKKNKFHPSLLRLIQQAPEIKSWRLNYRQPIPTYVCGRAILIGDAAHPMFPFNAQGGNQALEDCGALYSLFSNLPSKKPEVLAERMRVFNMVRRKRASRMQVISSVPSEEVKDISREVLLPFEEDGYKYGEPEKDRFVREFSYDVFARCEEALSMSTS